MLAGYTTPLVSPAGTTPAPSVDACPAHWRWPATCPAGTWLWHGRIRRICLSTYPSSRSKSRPARVANLLCGRRPGGPQSVGQPHHPHPSPERPIPRHGRRLRHQVESRRLSSGLRNTPSPCLPESLNRQVLLVVGRPSGPEDSQSRSGSPCLDTWLRTHQNELQRPHRHPGNCE